MFGVLCLEFGAWGLVSWVLGVGFWFQGLWLEGLNLGYGIWNVGFTVQNLWFVVCGSGLRVYIHATQMLPNTFFLARFRQMSPASPQNHNHFTSDFTSHHHFISNGWCFAAEVWVKRESRIRERPLLPARPYLQKCVHWLVLESQLQAPLHRPVCSTG